MFFWIEGPVDLSNRNHLASFENLGESGYAGRHLVLGDRLAIAEIASDSSLSRKASAYFRSVLSKYAQLGGIGRSLRKFKVRADCHSPSLVAGEWVVPVDLFKWDSALERTLIVVEHMYDYQVINALAEIAMREQGVSSFARLNLNPVSGGGGGTSLTLTVHQKNAFSMGLCVVDSDRPHVKGGLGNTAKGCIKVFSDRWGWDLHILGARELENIVPPVLYETAGVATSIRGSSLYSNEAWPIYGYMDIKLGDCVCRFGGIDKYDQSFVMTQAAIARLPAPWSVEGNSCPSVNCNLCGPDDGVLGRLAAKVDSHSVSRVRTLSDRVPALSELVEKVMCFGAAARWSML